jgi:cell division inhibitor SepF
MAGMLRKSMVYLGLVDDEDEEYDDRYDERDEDDHDRRPRRDERVPVRAAERPADRHLREPVRSPARAAAPARRVDRTAAYDRVEDYDDEADVRRVGAPVTESYRITTLQPRTYNEARTIGEHFRDGVPVIINLTEMDDSDAKRLVDFCAGLIFGLHGSIERVTNKVFLLSPSNVEVSEADKARIAEGGFFNQS